MKKILFLLIVGFAILSQLAFSQTRISFVNNTEEAVNAACAKYNDKTGWTTEGWWVIEAHSQKEISLGDYQYDIVYVYGYSGDLEWGNGEYQFCIDPQRKFSFANADINCSATKKVFSDFYLAVGEVNEWTFDPLYEGYETDDETEEYEYVDDYTEDYVYTDDEVTSEDVRNEDVNTNENTNTNVNNNTTSDVVIYTLPGCGMCSNAINYLNKNGIKYTEYSTGNDEYNRKMWKALYDSGKFKQGNSIYGPVIVKNNEVFFNIDNLDNVFKK